MEQPTRHRTEETEPPSEQPVEDPVDEYACEECGSTNLVTSVDQGELVCEECGLILEEVNIDLGPEWRAFNTAERESKSRVGAPMTQRMHDKGLTTSIDWRDQDISGRILSADQRSS